MKVNTSGRFAFLWMLGASGFAILIGVSGRELSSEMSLFQVMFCRNLVCLIATIFAMYFIGWSTIRTRFIGRHLVRNIIHFLATYLWFFGIVSIPMAEVFALEFTTPLWTAILAAVFLGERFGVRRVVGILLGFVGVLVILRPGLAMIHSAAFAVIGSAIMLAAMYVLTKSVIAYDSPLDDTVLDESSTAADFFNVCYTGLDLAIDPNHPMGRISRRSRIWNPLLDLKSAGLCRRFVSGPV
ncbi:MAG: hypothetical protein CM1200mP41_21950 [Gammaproteobacteria bacterium]|nr:MAG: hypothetical protein CM1200mP41_21950 [Gammaproteobacteria bacterium]